jgi:hypothetical protein
VPWTTSSVCVCLVGASLNFYFTAFIYFLLLPFIVLSVVIFLGPRL